MTDNILFAALCLIWGSTWLAIKIGLDGVPPFLAAGLRFTLASTTLSALIWIKGVRLKLTRNDEIAIASCGLLSFFLSYAGVYWAEQRISSGLTAMIYCTMPLSVALLSRFWMRSEQLGPRKAAGILIGMAGTALLFLPDLRSGGFDARAMAVTFASAVAAALNLVQIKRYGARTNIYVLNALGMGIGAVCMFSMSLLMDSYVGLHWTPSNVLAVIYLALIGSVTAFMAYYRLLRTMEATRLSLVTLIFPIVAVVLGWFVLGERIAPLSLAGMLLILSGVGLTIAPSARALSSLDTALP